MTRYLYKAVDQHGNPVAGELDAAGPHEVAERLAAVGLKLESAVPRQPEPSGSAERLSTEEAVELSSHMAQIVKSGLPLASGLRALAAELPSGRLTRILGELASQLEAGIPLEAAVQSHGGRFPAHVRGLVLAGVRSGKLATVLEHFVHEHRVTAELRRQVSLLLAYPAFLIGVIFAIFVLFELLVVPTFAKIYADFGTTLPVLTQFVIWMSRGIPPALIFVAAVCLFLAVFWTLRNRATIRRLFYLVPLVGPLWRWTSLAEFLRLLGLLVESEIPLPAALELAGKGIRDGDLSAACRWMAQDVAAGQAISVCVRRMRQFPASLAPIVEWGERSAALSESLRAAAEMFEGRLHVQASLVKVILPPLAFLFVAVMVGLLVCAIFLPLISLIQCLS
ncbi:MAG: type II secretion system F family protein [Pirellulales bacterium]